MYKYLYFTSGMYCCVKEVVCSEAAIFFIWEIPRKTYQIFNAMCFRAFWDKKENDFFSKFPFIFQGNNVNILTKIFLINKYKKGADNQAKYW